MVGDLKYEIDETILQIKRYKRGLEESENRLLKLQSMTGLSNRELYEGIVKDFTYETKFVRELNMFYGHSQLETNQYNEIDCIYVDSNNYFLSEEQKKIVKDYVKSIYSDKEYDIRFK